MAWVILTCFAAFFQAFRNALKNKLSHQLDVIGVTLSRFFWACPLAFIYLYGLYEWKPVALPDFSYEFLLLVIGVGVMQIAATALLVVIFKQKSFSVGAGLAKCEAPMAAFIGFLFFNTTLDFLGVIGVLIGAIAVLFLSSSDNIKAISAKVAILGILCSIAFALTSLLVREAGLSLSLPFPYSAAWVLFLVLLFQNFFIVLFLLFKNKETLMLILKPNKLVVMTSVSSFIASLCWFSAMSLQAVPYVKTLGQIEVLFMMCISLFWLKEKVKIKEILSLLLIVISAIFVLI
jgi:drug/metabolite transporter (DMT)-like permease